MASILIALIIALSILLVLVIIENRSTVGQTQVWIPVRSKQK